MQVHFNPDQLFQLEAIAPVADLFDGQPQGAPDYAVIDMGSGSGLFAGQQQTELGAGNRMLVSAKPSWRMPVP
ncbi:hypothetical protein FBQ96_07305 [Nitrospirales bacterium NOB]|nr:MAG: hypothetical protein UZ03_NOB001002224 [Nitrospira sp. OLB3]MBV6468399.1 hypothetical protein [Nitrospirota bacterium]MCE7963913.1 hypothetical protein [Nitrospira sp. NTP2]MCK6498296.1 hypothetical protein [Nitrospira sp.]MDL1889372.1 hypothetical protein [Nitrospirales bacterium NOB]MEB2339679.1 hypothetical protein [Nitrospirales bacterium]